VVVGEAVVVLVAAVVVLGEAVVVLGEAVFSMSCAQKSSHILHMSSCSSRLYGQQQTLKCKCADLFSSL
jgi:hypothetical protein